MTAAASMLLWWVCAALALLAFPLYMPMAEQPGLTALTEDPLPYELLMWGCAGWALLRAGLPPPTWPGSFRRFARRTGALPALGVIFLSVYVHILSESLAPVEGPAMGTLAPSLDGLEGASASWGPRRTLVVFQRAAWCPFCSRELQVLRSLAHELSPRDGRIVVVVPGFASRSGPPEPQGLTVLFDAEGEAFARWGLRDSFLGEPSGRPAAFLISRDGRIERRFMADDWRHRLPLGEARRWLRGEKP